MRATIALRNVAKAAAEKAASERPAAEKKTRSAPMSADHTLYHAHPTGFWKKFRDAVVVNPEISSGLPIPSLNRYPQPGSRTEKYATPATKASDPAFNPYYKRDTRRAYPQQSVITQSHLSTLLLSSPSLASLPSPSTGKTTPSNSSAITPTSDATTTITTSSVPSLSSVLEKLPVGTAFMAAGIHTGEGSGNKMPPVPPQRNGGKWVPKVGGEIPHDPEAYWPMIGYQ